MIIVAYKLAHEEWCEGVCRRPNCLTLSEQSCLLASLQHLNVRLRCYDGRRGLIFVHKQNKPPLSSFLPFLVLVQDLNH